MDEKLLRDKVRTTLRSAELIYEDGADYTSAAMLYFKALFAMADHVIFVAANKIPRDHTERFQMLKDVSPHIYRTLDKLFTVYRSTYSLDVDKKTCTEVREHVKRINEKYFIDKGT